ncbi:energy transducer TonB [Methylobacterium sp. NEAU K]|uniref:energy transducer TonB n=1 Tax=Methylobacterium sp. NEAU K TaxID=3064946 RepID=UPI002737041A|nr:energy transducer TonB [Methylobacterium sp. NEAU K]MDP4002598.1 energy transducer TonB [Methylobacterium sp. NEAU K]
MSSYVSTPQFLAAGSGLGGLGYMMTHPEPSVRGVAIGLCCLVLCAGFAAMPTSQKRARPAPVRSPPPRPEAQEARHLAGPQPHRLLMMEIPQPASKLPEVPTHRQRINDRQRPRES